MKNKKIVDEKELLSIITSLKNDNKKIVFTSGCFDIIHAGHVLYLEDAKEKGDVLVVLLNSDSSVKGLKGETRPIVDEFGRASVLSGLESVDYICLFDDETPCRLIEKMRPDVVIKGGDYKGKHIPEMDMVDVYGGVVEYVTMVDGCSTTKIIEKILSVHKEGGII